VKRGNVFFKKLFDTKFENFVTRDVARVLYIFMIALLAVSLLIAEVFGFLLLTGDGYLELGFLMILGSPLLALVSLIIIRVGFESSIALVSIAENTKK
jgi:hypothetical protein